MVVGCSELSSRQDMHKTVLKRFFDGGIIGRHLEEVPLSDGPWEAWVL